MSFDLSNWYVFSMYIYNIHPLRGDVIRQFVGKQFCDAPPTARRRMDETVTRLFAAAGLGSGDSGPIADCGYQYRYSLNIRFNEGGGSGRCFFPLR